MTNDWTELAEIDLIHRKSGAPWQTINKSAKRASEGDGRSQSSSNLPLKQSKSVNFDLKKSKTTTFIIR